MNPQNYYISLDAPASSVLIRSHTDASALFSGPTLVHGDILPVRLFWCRENGLGGATQAEVGEGSSVIVSARPAGVPVASPLLFQSNLVWNADGYHEGTIHLNTAEVAAHLAADPAGAKTILMEAQLSEGTTTLRSFQWMTTLTPQVYADQTAPTALPNAEEWLATRAATSVAGRTGSVVLTSADITDASGFGRNLLAAADAAAAREQLQSVGAEVEILMATLPATPEPFPEPEQVQPTMYRTANIAGKEAFSVHGRSDNAQVKWDAQNSRWVFNGTISNGALNPQWVNPSQSDTVPLTGWVANNVFATRIPVFSRGCTRRITSITERDTYLHIAFAKPSAHVPASLANKGELHLAVPLLGHQHTSTEITDASAAGRALLTAASAASQRTELRVPASDPTGITGASAVTNIVRITQADYNAITTPDPNITYIIIP